MLEGLYAAAAGMSAQQQQMDAIGNDLANVSTSGYKAERVGFSDLLYNKVNQAGTSTTTGAGAIARVIGRSSAQGAFQQTGEPLDLAIQGEGFFQVKSRGGKLALTRNGSFSARREGPARHQRRLAARPADHAPRGREPRRNHDLPAMARCVRARARSGRSRW